VTSGQRKIDKETWWWNETVQEAINNKKKAKMEWDKVKSEEKHQAYKERQKLAKVEVAMAKEKAYSNMYEKLDTKGGEKELYRLAKQRNRDSRDVLQVKMIKDASGNVLTSKESSLKRWKEYYENLMNIENPRETRQVEVEVSHQDVESVSNEEVRNAMRKMKKGKAVGPDQIPVEAWRCMGEMAVGWFTKIFNDILKGDSMPEEWRKSLLIPVFKNKGDAQDCNSYRGIKLMSHAMKLWERVVEARLRKIVKISGEQFGFMPGRSTTDAIFALRSRMEKFREGQKEQHYVFIDLEKAYDRVPREELWYCMRVSGIPEAYIQVVRDMYQGSITAVKSAAGLSEYFSVGVGLHQGSALSPFLFAIVMDRLTDTVRKESPQTMMFADDVVLCCENWDEAEVELEKWRYALERRGMRVSRTKTEYLSNSTDNGAKIVLQGEEIPKVEEFKYLGSTVQSNGECTREIKRRVQAGWNS
jgi:hypothetical protein